jgi:hypothetical protein
MKLLENCDYSAIYLFVSLNPTPINGPFCLPSFGCQIVALKEKKIVHGENGEITTENERKIIP